VTAAREARSLVSSARRARAWRTRRRLAGPRLIRAFADARPQAFFIEIGSNDGSQHDHLRPHILERAWTGIMVEPVPYVFERLRRNYDGIDRVTLENVAIAERDGELSFHYLEDASEDERRALPDWYDGIGSFSRDAVLSHASHIPDLEGRLVSRPVPTLTFESLCERHAVERLDLLLIDTEGYDWRILRSIDLERRRPQLLVYEHYHLSRGEQAECVKHLRRHGYRMMAEGFDTFCLADEVGGALRATWGRLRPAVPAVSKHEEPS
jgi:FkbM family methyltransferase